MINDYEKPILFCLETEVNKQNVKKYKYNDENVFSVSSHSRPSDKIIKGSEVVPHSVPFQVVIKGISFWT